MNGLNNNFIKNIIILTFCVVIIHVILNTFLMTDEPFETSKPKIKVYLFWASWCGHCRTFKPIFNDFKTDMLKQVEIIEIQADNTTDEISKLMKKYGVNGFPSVVIVKDDEQFKLLEGARTKTQLIEEVNKFI